MTTTMTMTNWYDAGLTRDLHAAGFDICHPFCPQWYNQRLAQERLLDLRPLPAASDGHRALLIGNTKHLWHPFVQWCQQQQQQQQQLPANPLDTYCREQIEAIVSKHCLPPRTTKKDDEDNDITTTPTTTTTQIFWSHSYDNDTLVSMQRVALVSGLAYWDGEATAQLSVHPVFGPWLSYRAVVVVVVTLEDDSLVDAATTTTPGSSILPLLDSVEPDPPPPPPPPAAAAVRLSPTEQQRARVALRHAISLCHDSSAGASTSMLCQQQLHPNQNSNDDDRETTIAQAWIAVRDCIETGRVTHRFGTNQLLYHYTQNAKYLVADD